MQSKETSLPEATIAFLSSLSDSVPVRETSVQKKMSWKRRKHLQSSPKSLTSLFRFIWLNGKTKGLLYCYVIKKSFYLVQVDLIPQTNKFPIVQFAGDGCLFNPE